MRINVLVTSGGTVEKIDSVRSIANMSTGKLGSLIADGFGAEACVESVFYVCGESAVRPLSAKAVILPVGSVSDLENTLKSVFSDTNIDIIVHSMAVSDYRVKSVTSAAALAGALIASPDAAAFSGGRGSSAELAELIGACAPDFRAEGKIGSDIDDMLLLMERTPKVISLFSSMSPQSTLVGFKLLHNVPLEALIEKGFQVLTQNGCSYVLANDLRDITGGQHVGYLIDRDNNYMRYSTKAEIAAAIVSAAIDCRGARV